MSLNHRLSTLLLVIVLSACSDPDTPEQQLRQWLAEVEDAAEQRSAGELRRAVADDYRDEAGHDKADLSGLIRLYLLRHQSIHLLTRIQSIELPAPDQGSMVVLAAMAGSPLADIDALTAIRADLYRFEFELVYDGDDWLLKQARWRPAGMDDFFNTE